MRRDFKRHLDSLAGLYEFSEAIMAEKKLPDGVRFPVHLAMEELFVNMVHYNPTVTTDIEVTVSVDGVVRVSLVDNGGAEFDVTVKREVDTDSPLVDTLEYEYQDGRGEVIFTKGSGTEDV